MLWTVWRFDLAAFQTKLICPLPLRSRTSLNGSAISGVAGGTLLPTGIKLLSEERAEPAVIVVFILAKRFYDILYRWIQKGVLLNIVGLPFS